MFSRFACVGVLLLLVTSARAVDTLILLPKGEDPNAVTGDGTYQAVWNGTSYDPINVAAWLRDVGDNSSNEDWRGYQLSFDWAVPSPGCTGNVRPQVGTLEFDTDHPDWLFAGYTGVFMTIPDVPSPGPTTIIPVGLMQCPCPGLGDSAAYLQEHQYTIEPGSSGTWTVKLRCLISDDCPGGQMCDKSATPCLGDYDCPRWTILGDETDVCTTGIQPDALTIVWDGQMGRVDTPVFALHIEIPVGPCCDHGICLGDDWTAEDCAAVPGAVWTAGRDCGDPCNECGNGVLELGEACDDGNNIGGDGCSAGCKTEAPLPAPATSPWAMAILLGSLTACVSRRQRQR